jgi:hypothetical protein
VRPGRGLLAGIALGLSLLALAGCDDDGGNGAQREGCLDGTKVCGAQARQYCSTYAGDPEDADGERQCRALEVDPRPATPADLEQLRAIRRGLGSAQYAPLHLRARVTELPKERQISLTLDPRSRLPPMEISAICGHVKKSAKKLTTCNVTLYGAAKR